MVNYIKFDLRLDPNRYVRFSNNFPTTNFYPGNAFSVDGKYLYSATFVGST